MKKIPLFVPVAVMLLLLAIPAVSGQEYIVRSGYDSPVLPGAEASKPVPVPFYALPISIILAEIVLFPAELLLSLKMFASLGFRRVLSSNVLDQDARAHIFEHIRRNPGIHLRGLATEMEMKMGTLRYHLNVLRLTHKITVTGNTASTRFYENNGTYSSVEQHILKHLRNETTRKILNVLLDRPTASRQDLAEAVGVTGPSVSWHMKRLEEDHIVIPRREGRVTAYEIPAPVAGYLSRQIGVPVVATG